MFQPRSYKKLLIIMLVLVTALVTLECSLLRGKKEPKGRPVPIPVNEDGSNQVLIHDGDNTQPSFSAEGDRILFVSRKRPNHQQAQVYELNFNTGNLRRITFQNGEVTSPHYTPDGQSIVYASSTDEVKETPSFLKKEPAKNLPLAYQNPSELYLHSLRAFDITRLTSHTGFDGEEKFLTPHEISFTRVDGAGTHIMTQALAAGKSAHEVKGLGVNPVQYVVAPNGKARAWIEWDKEFANSKLQLVVGSAKPVELNSDMLVDKGEPAFSSDSKFLVWSQKEDTRKTGNIWFTEIDKVCPREALAAEVTELRSQPILSPDMRWLLFASVKDGGSRIVRAGFKPAEHSCPQPK